MSIHFVAIFCNFDDITHIYDLSISRMFVVFLQKFPLVTVCPVQGTDTTVTGYVGTEK